MLSFNFFGDPPKIYTYFFGIYSGFIPNFLEIDGQYPSTKRSAEKFFHRMVQTTFFGTDSPYLCQT